MADGRWGREIAGMKRVGHQLECDGAGGQGRGLIHQLLAGGILDPELSLVGADAVDRALVELGAIAVAGFIDGELDGRGTAVQNQYGQRRHERTSVSWG
jgi:hypothetical protein